MVFVESIKKYGPAVKEGVDELFNTAFENQKVDTDLLIVLIHGSFGDEHLEFSKKNKLSPYIFGPGHVGFSLDTFYEFFDSYRSMTMSRTKFLKALKSPKTKDKMEHWERLNTNLELLIYLKFWESDLLLRQLFNLSNLSCGKHYEWHFTKIRSRTSFIKNQIHAPLKEICPKFYSLIEETYSPDVRNAVAHSKYYFLGRNLHLDNKDEGSQNKLSHIPFDDWEIRFHKILLLYNFIIGNKIKYDEHYQNEVKDKHFGLPLSIPTLNKVGLRKNQWVKYDSRFKRWLWSTQIDQQR